MWSRRATIWVDAPSRWCGKQDGWLSDNVGILPRQAETLSDNVGILLRQAGTLSDNVGILPRQAGTLSDNVGPATYPSGVLFFQDIFSYLCERKQRGAFARSGEAEIIPFT